MRDFHIPMHTEHSAEQSMRHPLQGRRLVLGVTGGVAAYKAAELARLLVKAGVRVDAVLSAAGSQFVGAATFQALTGRPVWSDLWDARMSNGMAHIDLSREADAILIAPATADTLARLAQGRADDLLSTLCLAREPGCALLVAPAMNRQMWEHPATQRNVAQLRADRVTVLGPASGEQACGEVGMGRMLEPDALFEALIGHFTSPILAGQRVLMTAGPTQEAIDPVRVVTNLSSGRMGYALAQAAARAGAQVTLVSGPTGLACPAGVERIDVRSALQMRQAVMERVAQADLFIGVAAVADFRPACVNEHKIKKKGAGTLTLEMVANPDILAEVASLPAAPFCVGFAAESGNLDHYAQEKRVAKRLPLVVGNLVNDALGTDDNRVVLYDAAGAHPLPRAAKEFVASAIVEHIAQRMAAR